MTFKQYCEMILGRKLFRHEEMIIDIFDSSSSERKKRASIRRIKRLAPRKRIKALKSRCKGMNSDFVIVDEWITSPNAKSEADKFYRFLKETTGGAKNMINVINNEALKKLESGDVIELELGGTVIYLATEKWAEKMEKVGGIKNEK